MSPETPPELRSTMAMIEATFGPDHRYLAKELHALVEIMAEDGMSNRQTATVIAMCLGKSPSDYCYHLQEVSWQVWNPRRDPTLKNEIRARLMNFGYAEWAKED
jgi:hypothetical protein